MRLLTWNVNGLRAIGRKGFRVWLEAERPDVLLLQEIKARPEDLPRELREIPGYRARFLPAVRRGYSGVAAYVLEEPDEWIEGLGDERFDVEGRFLSLRYGDLLVSSAYFPNSQEGGARLPYRLAFGAAVLAFTERQRAAGRKVLIGGDFNVAHEEIDLARPKQNTKNPGFLPEERAWFSSFLAAGFRDTFRDAHPGEPGHYTWWSFRAGARSRNIGWRIDYFCAAAELAPAVAENRILSEVQGSDHCPVEIRLVL